MCERLGFSPLSQYLINNENLEKDKLSETHFTEKGQEDPRKFYINGKPFSMKLELRGSATRIVDLEEIFNLKALHDFILNGSKEQP